MAIEKLGPQGLTFKADEVRSVLGLSNPEEGDEVVGGRAEYGIPASGENGEPREPSLNAEQGTAPDADVVDMLVEESRDDFTVISDEIVSVIEQAFEKASDFKSLKTELERLTTEWKPDKIAELMAVAFFKARAWGAQGAQEEWKNG
jgi:phage gp29-like protein